MKRSHGTGNISEYKDGFRLKWSTPEGGRGSKVLRPSTRRQAEQELRRILAEVDRGEHQDDRRGAVTFDAFFKDWLALRELEVKPSTFKNLVSLHKTVLSPTFGSRKLNTITRRSVDLWWAKHSSHPVTRRNAYYALRGALEQAVDWGMLSVSPCKVKDPGKDVSKKRPTWSVEDFDAVLSHVDAFYRPAIEVMFAGHLRLGELIALDWSDVSRDGLITVTKQKLGLGFTADTKTGQHKRIKLLQRGVDALQKLPRGIGSTPLFPGKRAERMPRRSLQDAWDDALKAAGYENFHVHDVRHIGLSLVAEAGASERVVQEPAGHASATFTRRYLHSNERMHADAVRKVDALVSKLRDKAS
ncbi:site-specific integrase [Microbacterium sp. CFBP 8790]|nr:site-specific integrase [Microbacterium sp. CFBP 8790]MBD8509843.1 site-specific integrase [Microbacterium sp. CFBP 8790]